MKDKTYHGMIHRLPDDTFCVNVTYSWYDGENYQEGIDHHHADHLLSLEDAKATLLQWFPNMMFTNAHENTYWHYHWIPNPPTEYKLIQFSDEVITEFVNGLKPHIKTTDEQIDRGVASFIKFNSRGVIK